MTRHPVLFLALLCLAACHRATPAAQYRHLTIKEFKKSVDSAVKAGDTTTKNFEIQGYYVNEKVPLLVSSLDLMRSNALLPDSAYIVLEGAGIDSVLQQEHTKRFRHNTARTGSLVPSSYEGALVSTRIAFHVTDRRLRHFIVHERPLILHKAQQVISHLDKQVTLLAQRLQPAKPPAPASNADKYAFLYSGGFDSVNAHIRFWNDLQFMYNTLVTKYGFPEKNIIVVYAQGQSEDGSFPVDYPATLAGFKTAVNTLNTRLTPNSLLFMFFTNHGGGYDTLAAVSEGGRADQNHDEETQDGRHWDEELYLYQQTPNDLWDDSLTSWFTGLRYNKMIIVGEPCFSGGLIHDLRGPNRMIFTAANQYENSYGDYSTENIDFDTFSYYFTAALNQSTYDGKPVNADTNGDGKISMLEAFRYAQAMDKETEHPEMDDSGDGIPTSSPTATSTHGRLAANTWLK